jgi:plasmid stability protein
MWLTCYDHFRMSKMIQLRHVPDALHRRLKARAAIEGLSLSDFLIREARRIAERPTMEEIRSRLAGQASVRPRISPTQVLRAERDQR